MFFLHINNPMFKYMKPRAVGRTVKEWRAMETYKNKKSLAIMLFSVQLQC